MTAYVAARSSRWEVASSAIAATTPHPLHKRTSAFRRTSPHSRAGADGGVFAFGDRTFVGSTGGQRLNAPVVDVASTPSDGGYLLAAEDGGVFAFGDARFSGAGSNRIGCGIPETVGEVAALASGSASDASHYWTASGKGYVFAFGGDYHGSLLGVLDHQGEFETERRVDPTRPIVDIENHPTRLGYWLVGGDGGVFTFGESEFFGSLASTHLNAPIVGIASTPAGDGYWLVAADGGVFTFGTARFLGSMAATPLSAPVVGIASTGTGAGYWLAAADGGVFAFGDATYRGSMSGTRLAAPVVGIAA